MRVRSILRQRGYLGAGAKRVLGGLVGEAAYRHFLSHPSFDAPLQTTAVLVRGSGNPTFTRATTKTFLDWEGVVKTALSGEVAFQGARRVHNLLTPSTTLGFSSATTCTQTTGIADPVGGTSAFTLSATGPNAGRYQVSVVTVGNQFRFSAWVKRRTGNGTIALYNGDDAASTTTITVTASWQRFAGSVVTANGATTYAGIFIATSGDEVDVYLPQYEDVTGQSNQNPGEAVSVGVLSSPYHGAMVDGVAYPSDVDLASGAAITGGAGQYENGNTVTNNVVTHARGPAIPNPTAAGIERGYLAEQGVTNLCLRSQEFDNASWTASNITVAADAVAAPDGTTTAETLTASAGNGTVIQDLGVIASAVKTFSVWLKRKTGTGDIDLTLDGGATWTTKTITSSWARYSITQTLADPDCGIRIVTNADAVLIWGAQVEALAFATSYIATTSATVTRSADTLSYTLAGNIDNTVGTAYAEYEFLSWGALNAAYSVIASNGGTNAVMGLQALASSGFQNYDGTTSCNGPTGSPSGVVKACLRYSAAGGKQRVACNGVLGSEVAFDGSFNLAISLTIGTDNGATTANAVLRNVRIWPFAATDAAMMRVTS